METETHSVLLLAGRSRAFLSRRCCYQWSESRQMTVIIHSISHCALQHTFLITCTLHGNMYVESLASTLCIPQTCKWALGIYLYAPDVPVVGTFCNLKSSGVRSPSLNWSAPSFLFSFFSLFSVCLCRCLASPISHIHISHLHIHGSISMFHVPWHSRHYCNRLASSCSPSASPPRHSAFSSPQHLLPEE